MFDCEILVDNVTEDAGVGEILIVDILIVGVILDPIFNDGVDKIREVVF